MSSTKSRRLPVPLTEHDDAELALLRADSHLEDVVGLTRDASDAALVHAVFELGLRQVREARLDLAYRALAVEYDDASAREVARRRRPLTGDDE